MGDQLLELGLRQVNKFVDAQDKRHTYLASECHELWDSPRRGAETVLCTNKIHSVGDML